MQVPSSTTTSQGSAFNQRTQQFSNQESHLLPIDTTQSIGKQYTIGSINGNFY